MDSGFLLRSVTEQYNAMGSKNTFYDTYLQRINKILQRLYNNSSRFHKVTNI